MSQSEFPRHLIDEADRLLIQIRAAGDQIEALVSRARDVLILAKRTVLENGKFDQEMELGEKRIRQADQVIEREAQREVERREHAIDEGRIIPRGGRYAADAALRTEERRAKREGVAPPRWEDLTDQERAAIAPVVHGITALMTAEERAATMQDIADLSGQGEAEASEIDLAPGITMHKDTPPDVVDEYYRGFGTMFDRAEEHDANGGNLLLTDEALSRGGDRPLFGKTLEEAAVEFVRGTIAAQTQIEESLPGQAEGVNTGAAEAVSPQPVEAAPVNEQDSSAVENAPEEAAEEAKVIPPEDFSAADEKPPLGDRFYRQKLPEPTQDAVDVAARERQNANAREAAEFSDKVLDLWSTTLLTEAQIAKRLETGKALIVTVLEQARTEQDPRVTGKRGVQPKPKEHMPLSAIARKIMERPAPVAAARAGVELGKFDPPTKGGEKSSLISTGVCVVDIDNLKIYGKRGVWTASKPQVETVVLLNNGQMYPKEVITQRCGWSSGRDFLVAITPMMERLRDIGIVMTSTLAGIVIRVDD